MATHQITHTRKDGIDADRRIDAVGIGGSVYPLDQVIYWIDSGQHRFFVIACGKSVWVVAKTHPISQRRYLTTEGDGYPPNNLLNLPNC